MAKKSEEQQEDVSEPVTVVALDSKSVTQVLSLGELAARHRISTWQQAALTRLMGWQEGKVVTDADYRAALDRLNARRLGSGRKE